MLDCKHRINTKFKITASFENYVLRVSHELQLFFACKLLIISSKSLSLNS